MALIDVTDTTTLLTIVVVGFVAWLFSTRYQSGLHKFPGPFLASITPAYRAFYAYFYPQHILELDLHKKYGPIVRIAPNILSFADPDVQAHVYTRDFHKNEAYLAHAPSVHGEIVPNLFSETDFIRHDRLRRAVTRAFSSLNVSQYEPKIDSAIDTLVQQLSAKSGSSVDLIDWSFRFAIDVIGDILYGQKYGMLDSSADVSSIRKTLLNINRRNNLWRRWPLLDKLFRRNNFCLWLNKQGVYNLGSAPEMPIIEKNLSARLALGESSSGKLEDMVAELLWAQKLYPDVVTDRAIRGLAGALTNPGSDKMSITISMLMYFLLSNRECYDKLSKEVSALFGSKNSTSASAFTYEQASKSPYLDAVIKETFRLHPASSTYMERIAPVAGAWVCNLEMTHGVIVGCSPVVVNRNKAVYGADADVFRPERWLEANPDQLTRMSSRLFDFGQGVYQCLGKNISLIELYKVVPCLLQNLEFELTSSGKKPAMEDSVFYHVRGIKVMVRRK